VIPNMSAITLCVRRRISTNSNSGRRPAAVTQTSVQVSWPVVRGGFIG
jgi:hypothetical protein